VTRSEHSVDELADIVEDLQTRVSDLEADNHRLIEENQRLREQLEAKDEVKLICWMVVAPEEDRDKQEDRPKLMSQVTFDTQ
jgi:regulator of replication initiation timing